MNKLQKRRGFPSLKQFALVAGIVVVLLIGSFLVISPVISECSAASPTCIYHLTTIKIKPSGLNESALPEPDAISTTCNYPGSTGWTGSICESSGPTPTPTTQPADCVLCLDNPAPISGITHN